MKRVICTSAITIFLLFQGYVQAQTWNALGGINAINPNIDLLALCADRAGSVYAAGIDVNSGFHHVVKWDGTTWSVMGTGFSGSVQTLCSDPTGNVYATGGFSDATNNSYVAKFDGNNWIHLDSAYKFGLNSSISDYLPLCNDATGNIYFSGGIQNDSGKTYVAKFNGTSWSELGGLNALAANGEITSLCSDLHGNIYAAGDFTNTSGKTYVAKFNGTSWSQLGGSNAIFNFKVYSLCSDIHGNIYAAGSFTNDSNKTYVAKFDGTSWSELGGLNSLRTVDNIWAMCTDLYGNVYVVRKLDRNSGKNFVARFDGTSWSELGTNNGFNSAYGIKAICADAFGNIYITARDSVSGNGYVAKYGNYTGINNITFKPVITVYPNPSEGNITIQLSEEHSSESVLSIFDILGREVYRAIHPAKDIQVKLMEKGVYLVRYSTDNASLVRKVVVQ